MILKSSHASNLLLYYWTRSSPYMKMVLHVEFGKNTIWMAEDWKSPILPNLPYLHQIHPKNTACDSYILVTNNSIKSYDISLFWINNIFCTEDFLYEFGYNFL